VQGSRLTADEVKSLTRQEKDSYATAIARYNEKYDDAVTRAGNYGLSNGDAHSQLGNKQTNILNDKDTSDDYDISGLTDTDINNSLHKENKDKSNQLGEMETSSRASTAMGKAAATTAAAGIGGGVAGVAKVVGDLGEWLMNNPPEKIVTSLIKRRP
jgi:hypothetical protein